MTRFMSVVGVAAVLIAGSLPIWKAEATSVTPAPVAGLKGYSPVQQVGCIFGTSRCPAGTKWSCSKSSATAGVVKKCWCRPC
jgi:hypothetical protein